MGVGVAVAVGVGGSGDAVGVGDGVSPGATASGVTPRGITLGGVRVAKASRCVAGPLSSPDNTVWMITMSSRIRTARTNKSGLLTKART